MYNLIALLSGLCSLGFSVLTIIAFSIGLDVLAVWLLGFMSLISLGHAIANTKL